MASISLPEALVASSVISAGGSLIGGSDQADAANQAAQLQQQRYLQTRADLLPYNTGGQQAFGAANNLLMGSPSQQMGALEGLPGYQFTKTQGLKAVQNSAAARGLGVSGAALKGAATYATGLADTTYGDQFNRLMSSAQLGENAAAQTGVTGANLAGQQGNALIQAGNAMAGGITGAANAFATPLLGQGYGMYGGGSGYAAFNPSLPATPRGFDPSTAPELQGLF